MLKWIAGCLALILAAFVLWPIASPKPGPSPRMQAFSNVKHIGTATRIYADDFDSVLPNATSMPTIRAQLAPYCKTGVWNAVPETSTNPTFNFNVAGFNLSEGNQLGTNQSPSEVLTPVFYSLLIKPNNEYNVIRATLAGNTKKIPLEQLLDELSIQLERDPKSLAPANYLADQDPLKN